MKTFAFATIAVLALSGCAYDEPRGESQMAGESATDPVSGAEVPFSTPYKSYWNGELYYFESAENQRRFDENPRVFAPAPREERERPERRTIYPHDLQ